MAERVLVTAGATLREWAMIYKAVVHRVLLYIRKIWIVMDVMLKVLEGFHHRVDHRFAGMTYQKSG